jgi:hypothetical protein
MHFIHNLFIILNFLLTHILWFDIHYPQFFSTKNVDKVDNFVDNLLFTLFLHFFVHFFLWITVDNFNIHPQFSTTKESREPFTVPGTLIQDHY